MRAGATGALGSALRPTGVNPSHSISQAMMRFWAQISRVIARLDGKGHPAGKTRCSAVAADISEDRYLAGCWKCWRCWPMEDSASAPCARGMGRQSRSCRALSSFSSVRQGGCCDRHMGAMFSTRFTGTGITMDESQWKISLTTEVVAAYVRSNPVAVADFPQLIRSVHDAFAGAGALPATLKAPAPRPTSAEIRKSITLDALISFLDGKPYKMLKRHLAVNGLTFDEYRIQFGLPSDYPKTASSYSATRSAMAKAFGLGVARRKKVTAARKGPVKNA
jgi:predicted transcriptional regulator